MPLAQSIVRHFAVLLAFLSLNGALAQQAASGLRSMGNEHFDVIGLHLRSVSYVNELSAFTMQIAERYLPREALAFPSTILISLRPDQHVDFEGDYRIRLAERGTVQLDLRWEDSMTLERTCEAIVEALLVQYAVYNHGTEAASQICAWTFAALGKDVYFTLRPAKFVDLVQAAQESAAPILAEIVEPPPAKTEVPSAAGYWLLQAMKSSNMGRTIMRSLFQQAAAGINIEEALTSAVQPSEPTAEVLSLETWWTQQLSLILSQEYEVVETMETSREWLAALRSFDPPLIIELDEGTEELKLNLRSIWTQRAQPEVRELVQARYEILRLRMSRINPAYFNPAHSLGVVFEDILNDAPSYKYLHSLTIYLSEWEDAKAMQQALEKIL